MKKKTVYTLCIILIILASIFFLPSFSNKNGKIQPIISFNTIKNDSIQSLKSDSKDSTELSIIQTTTLPTYHFTSSEELEQISAEDLIFINQHNYKTVDFYPDEEFKELDLFGIEPDKEIYENVSIDFFWLKDLEIELDVTKPLPENEFQRLVDNDIEMMYYYANTQKPGEETGRVVVSKDTFFCGENDLYAEYSVRYTQRCTMYENDKLTSTDVPRAYRQVYLKNYVVETNVNDWRAYLLGELNADYVKEQLDVFHSYDSNPIIYREVIEQDNRYIYSTYYTTFEYSGWGKNNVVVLWNHKTYVYKNTHLVTNTNPFEIRRVEIPGTENDMAPVE